MRISYKRKNTAAIATSQKIVYESNPVRALVHKNGNGMIVLALLHPFLALAMYSSSLLATAHALFTLSIGLWFALGKDTRKVGYVAAYITGAEILWRMTNAQIFWETGKYFTILILGIALLRSRPWQRPIAPILYFVLLSISIPITLSRLGITSTAREVISFNLSGPLALMVCALYFSQIYINQNILRKMIWWIILPIIGIAILVLSGIRSAEQIAFTNDSNFVTSGGFGPNQVSAILGLGGGLTLLLFVTGKSSFSRWGSFFLMLGFLTLCALTFSRGGLYNAAIMAGLAFAHFLRDAHRRIAAIMAILILGLLGGNLIFPRLNAFTSGMLEQRFSNLDTTLRGKIAKADLDLWLANPVFGVGPGLSKPDRITLLGYSASAHTEYTRTLSEHGMFGFLALLLLVWMAARSYLSTPMIETQTWVVALLAWPLLEMSHAAMRIVAISFLFGLALVNWEAAYQATGHREKRP